MSDTPETDFIFIENCDLKARNAAEGAISSLVGHARKLERERDELKKALTNLYKKYQRLAESDEVNHTNTCRSFYNYAYDEWKDAYDVLTRKVE